MKQLVREASTLIELSVSKVSPLVTGKEPPMPLIKHTSRPQCRAFFTRMACSSAMLAVMVAGLAAFAAPEAPPKPNILFIAIDDLRPELGCYGKSYVHSPNIDRLASAGIAFNHAYCQEATCSPSRTAVLTGLRPDTSKVWDLVTSFRKAQPDVVTLGQQFMRNGYFVQGFSKIYHGGLNDPASWSVPWVDPDAPEYALPESAASFGKNTVPVDEDGPNNKGTDVNSYALPASVNQANKKTAKAPNSPLPNSRGAICECADVPDNFYKDGKTADLAVQAMDNLSKKSCPFFLAVGFIRPHLPWVAPKKYWALYDPETIPLAPNPFLPKGAPSYAISQNDGEVRAYKGIPPRGHVPDDVARKLKLAYCASVSYSDACVGRLLDELDRLGLRTNTIIILWGDHGWKLGEHDSWGKHTDVENDVNAPLILSVPGMKNVGTHCDALVEFVDIYPTLCDLAELPLPTHLEGVSFKPLLADPQRPWKMAAFSEYPRGTGRLHEPLMGYTMRTSRYRFTIWVSRKDHSVVDTIELYDDQKDPQENVNIARRPENAGLVKKLTQQWRNGWQAAKPPETY